MYGIKSKDVDKIGYTVLYSLLHVFIIGVASSLFCAICQYSQISLSIALFFCGYVTNTFIRTDIKEIWRE
jgi:small-conductance mechanosensitive channel